MLKNGAFSPNNVAKQSILASKKDKIRRKSTIGKGVNFSTLSQLNRSQTLDQNNLVSSIGKISRFTTGSGKNYKNEKGNFGNAGNFGEQSTQLPTNIESQFSQRQNMESIDEMDLQATASNLNNLNTLNTEPSQHKLRDFKKQNLKTDPSSWKN